MIRNFRHKGLERFFTKSDRAGLNTKHISRIERILDRMDAAVRSDDLNLSGYGFHALKGKRKGTYAVEVSGNWRITFGFKDGDATDVNLEDYH